jgi:hypothetical protein
VKLLIGDAAGDWPDRDHIGGRHQDQIGGAEDDRDRLDQRQVAGGDRIDHQSRDAGIVEDDLDHDDAPSKVDRLSAIALAIGPMALGKAWRSTTRAGEQPFSRAASQ